MVSAWVNIEAIRTNLLYHMRYNILYHDIMVHGMLKYFVTTQKAAFQISHPGLHLILVEMACVAIPMGIMEQSLMDDIFILYQIITAVISTVKC